VLFFRYGGWIERLSGKYRIMAGAAERLQILRFGNLAPGASVVLPHSLRTGFFNFSRLEPDIIFIPSADLVVDASTNISITLRNAGAVSLSGEVLVGGHTIEGAFGAVPSVKPYVVVSVERSGQPPQPPFTPATITIHARTTGSDNGTGSLANPYRTMKRAVRDVPSIIPPGVRFIVDITGITEELPLDYALPCWKAPVTINKFSDQFFLFGTAVEIRATPRLVAMIPAPDAQINDADIDIALSGPDAVTGLVTITLKDARGSWATNLLKGKFVVGTGGNVGINGVIVENTNSTILIATTDVPPTPIQIMEPSASISGTSTPGGGGFGGGGGLPRGCLNAINCDSIMFSGLRITTNNAPADRAHGLVIGGNGFGVAQMCELQSPSFSCVSQSITRVLRSWIKGTPRFEANIILANGLMDATTTNAATTTNFQNHTLLVLRRMAFEGCGPIDIGTVLPGGTFLPGDPPFLAAATVLSMENCLVRGATGDGMRFHGMRGRLSQIDISGCGGDGVRIDSGAGFVELFNVRTTGVANAGVGVRVNDGMQAKVDAATSGAAAGTQLRGAGGEMVVGDGDARTWANFVLPADGRPALNEYDITANAATGATGTGSRLSQDP
jgi:hypothetical protein